MVLMFAAQREKAGLLFVLYVQFMACHRSLEQDVESYTPAVDPTQYSQMLEKLQVDLSKLDAAKENALNAVCTNELYQGLVSYASNNDDYEQFKIRLIEAYARRERWGLLKAKNDNLPSDVNLQTQTFYIDDAFQAFRRMLL